MRTHSVSSHPCAQNSIYSNLTLAIFRFRISTYIFYFIFNQYQSVTGHATSISPLACLRPPNNIPWICVRAQVWCIRLASSYVFFSYDVECRRWRSHVCLIQKWRATRRDELSVSFKWSTRTRTKNSRHNENKQEMLRLPTVGSASSCKSRDNAGRSARLLLLMWSEGYKRIPRDPRHDGLLNRRWNNVASLVDEEKVPQPMTKTSSKVFTFLALAFDWGFSAACFALQQTACRNNMKHAHTHAFTCSVVRFTRQCNLFIYYPSVEIFNMPIFGGGSVGGDGGGNQHTDNNSIFGFSFIWLRIIFFFLGFCAERANIYACELEKLRQGARKYTRRHCTTQRIHNFYDRISCLSAAFWWDELALILFHFILGSSCLALLLSLSLSFSCLYFRFDHYTCSHMYLLSVHRQKWISFNFDVNTSEHAYM